MKQFIHRLINKLEKMKWYKNLWTKRYMRFQRKELQKGASHILELISDSFSDKIFWFIDFGTLLGNVRDNAIISFDRDIDIGVFVKNKELIKELLIPKGFALAKSCICDGEVVEESYVFGNIKTDIHFYSRSGDKCNCILLYNECDEKVEYKAVRIEVSAIDETETCILCGASVQRPQNYEILLNEKYGMEWRIPNPKWKYWNGPSANKIDNHCKVIMH